MATIIKGQLVGTWNGSIQIYADNFVEGGKLYLGNYTPDGGFTPRGKELVSGTGFVFVSGLAATDFAAFSSSPNSGMDIPTDLATAPNGWAKVFDSSGNPYFKKATSGTTNNSTTSNDTGVVGNVLTSSASLGTKIVDFVSKNIILVGIVVIGAIYLLSNRGNGKKSKKSFLGF